MTIHNPKQEVEVTEEVEVLSLNKLGAIIAGPMVTLQTIVQIVFQNGRPEK